MNNQDSTGSRRAGAERPIQDAADQVFDAALRASAMLDELRAGWLWQMLVKPPTPKAG